MIDIEYLKTIIYKQEEAHKIQPGEFIPLDVYHLLKEGTITTRTACFAPIHNKTSNPIVYPVEMECGDCGSVTTIELNKTRLMDVLKGTNVARCQSCEEKRQIEKQRKEQLEKERRQREYQCP